MVSMLLTLIGLILEPKQVSMLFTLISLILEPKQVSQILYHVSQMIKIRWKLICYVFVTYFWVRALMACHRFSSFLERRSSLAGVGLRLL